MVLELRDQRPRGYQAADPEGRGHPPLEHPEGGEMSENVSVPVEVVRALLEAVGEHDCCLDLADKLRALLPKPKSARAMLAEFIQHNANYPGCTLVPCLAQFDAERERLWKFIQSPDRDFRADMDVVVFVRRWLEDTK